LTLELPLQHFESLSLVPTTALQLGPLTIMLPIKSRFITSACTRCTLPPQRIRFLEFHAVTSYLNSSRIFAACIPLKIAIKTRHIMKSQQGLLARTRKELGQRR
jgi:hypothetical protein